MPPGSPTERPRGTAAAELATRTDAVNRILERHSGLAETVRSVFAVITVAEFVASMLPGTSKAWYFRVCVPSAEMVMGSP